MALWTKASLCVKSSLLEQSLPRLVRHPFGGTPSRPKTSVTSVNPVILSNLSSFLCAFCAFLWLKNPFNQRNPRLINDLRAYKSLYICRELSTSVESSLQIKLFMQNKANFRKVKSNINKVLRRVYDQLDTWSSGKKQSQTKPNKAKFKKAKMNVTSYITKAYENKPPIWAPKKQSQTSKRQKPMQTSLPKGIMKNTAFSGSEKQSQTNPISKQKLAHHLCGGIVNSLMIIRLYCIPAYFIRKSRIWKNSK
jgi:hypothetical protein